MASGLVRFCSQGSNRSRNQLWLASAARMALPLAAASLLHFGTTNTADSHSHTTQSEQANDKNPKDDGLNQPSFNILEQWKDAKDFIDKLVVTDAPEPSTQNGTDAPKSNGLFGFLSSIVPGTVNTKGNNKEDAESEENLKSVQKSLVALLTGRASEQTVQDLIAKARNSSEQGDVSDSVSLEDLTGILKRVCTEFDSTVKKYLEGKDLPPINLTNLHYFLEYEDERKNFSWRRRKHRFCPGINYDEVDNLYRYGRLSELGYSEDVDEIKKELNQTFGYELVFCHMDSLPGQPSHFLAVKKEQSQWSSSLDMMLVVRGTATITDVITDLLADAVDYRGGKAHSGIRQSGVYLAEKHLEIFQKFLEASGKKKVNLTLIGHSLGAGAASIAGIELQDRPEFDVKVIGFGCPALLTKELSESTSSYITTVVSDNDCIPRMSLPTMINALLDIGEFNWVPKAHEDLGDVIGQVQKVLPDLVTDSTKYSIMNVIESTVLSSIPKPQATQDRLEPILFPPGKCIHFYRDGYGLAGAVVPCTFFDSLDVNRRMVDDHLFDTGYRLVLLDLMRQYKRDHYFQFEIKKDS